MSKSLDLDDIEVMFADIVGQDNRQPESAFPQSQKQKQHSHRRLSEALEKTPPQQFFDYSETPTPAHEPLEFIASPIEQTAETLRSASESGATTPEKQDSLAIVEEGESKQTAKEPTKETVKETKESNKTENVPRLDIPEPEPQVAFRDTKVTGSNFQPPVSPMSKPVRPTAHRRRSSAASQQPEETNRLEKIAHTGTPQQIRAERESTSEGVAIPNITQSPEATIENAIRRASQSSPPNMVQSPRSFRLQSIAKEGTPAEIRAERESTSMGVLSPNLSVDPQGDMEKAIRRASSSSAQAVSTPQNDSFRRRLSSNAIDDEPYEGIQSPRTIRLQSVTKEGTPAEIRAERESTSEGVLSPNRSADPQGDMEKAIRRASSASATRPSFPNRRSYRNSRNAVPRRRLSSNAFAEGDAEPQSPRAFRLQSIAKEGTPAEIRAERESTSMGVLSPNLSADPQGDMEKAIRRASQESKSLKPAGRPQFRRLSSSVIDDSEDHEAPIQSPRTFRLQSIAKEGTPAQIRAERESTSMGILSPNLSADPQGDMEKAIRRASSSAGQGIPMLGPRTNRLESLTGEEEPATDVRRSRDTTSVSARNRDKSPGAVDAIAAGLRRASRSHSRSRSRDISRSRSRDAGSGVRPRRSSTAAEDARKSAPKEAIAEAVRELHSNSPKDTIEKRLSTSAIVESERTGANLSPETHRLQSIASEGTPSQIRSERESTSEGIPAPNKSGDAEAAISDAVRRSSDAGNSDDMLSIASERASVQPPAVPKIAEVTEPSTPVSEPQTKKPDSSTVYLYMSMASGGRGAMQNFQKATAILQSYNISFIPVEVSMDDDAKRIWKYRGISKGKQLPAIIRDREVKLDFKELISANEDEEVKEIIFEEF